MARHNKLRNGVNDLAGKAFTPNQFFTGRSVCGGKAKAKGKGEGVPSPEEG